MPIFYPAFSRIFMRKSRPSRGSLKPYMQMSWETIITSLESANTEFSIRGYEGQRETAKLIYGPRPTAIKIAQIRGFTCPRKIQLAVHELININRNGSQNSNYMAEQDRLGRGAGRSSGK